MLIAMDFSDKFSNARIMSQEYDTFDLALHVVDLALHVIYLDNLNNSVGIYVIYDSEDGENFELNTPPLLLAKFETWPDKNFPLEFLTLLVNKIYGY